MTTPPRRPSSASRATRRSRRPAAGSATFLERNRSRLTWLAGLLGFLVLASAFFLNASRPTYACTGQFTRRRRRAGCRRPRRRRGRPRPRRPVPATPTPAPPTPRRRRLHRGRRVAFGGIACARLRAPRPWPPRDRAAGDPSAAGLRPDGRRRRPRRRGHHHPLPELSAGERQALQRHRPRANSAPVSTA